MPILTPTAATGARSAPKEMTYVDPARTMPPDERDAFLEGTSLNGPFVADLLSDMMAHERAGARLYRSVAERTNNPVLKQRYTQFGKETTEHVEVLETLVTDLGGDRRYVSPAARATEKAGTGLLESTSLATGPVGLRTQELVMLDGVLLAESEHNRLLDGERWEERVVRFRTIGDATCTGATESAAIPARCSSAVTRAVGRVKPRSIRSSSYPQRSYTVCRSMVPPTR